MKSLVKFTTPILVIILFSMISIGCAKQGFPSGGPKDVTPPVAGIAQPPTGTLNFNVKEVYIPFDEYVVVKDAENNILVSPPMAKKPEYTPKGRGLLIKLKDTLRANTTYLFQFKGAIADLNEGNPLESYEYAFSTGDILDSMTLNGYVTDALTLKPREEIVTVMLYAANADDSVVVKDTPQYITRCNKEGFFEFNNIAVGSYRILAIEDGDRNLKLGADEAMAFSDTLVIAQKKVATPVATDSTQDSTIDVKALRGNKMEKKSDGAHLLMSQSETKTQRILKSGFVASGKIQIITMLPLKDFEIAVLACDTCDKEQLTQHLNSKGDTLTLWTANEKCDSIQLIVSEKDLLQDTLKLKLRKAVKGKRNTEQTSSLMKSNTGASVAFFDSIWVSFSNPITMVNHADSAVMVMNLKDSSITKKPLRISNNGMRGWVEMELEQGMKYEVMIEKDAVKDIYGHGNDTLKFSTEVTTASQYGNLAIAIGQDSLKLETDQVIIELISENKVVIQRQIIVKAEMVRFKNLKPGKYNVRVIMDKNGNGEWDAGEYWTKLQPEKVIYYPKTLEIRANWDMEERW